MLALGTNRGAAGWVDLEPGRAPVHPRRRRMLEHEDVMDRSRLASHLRGSIFPADRDAVVECAVAEGAPPQLVSRLHRLPPGTYANVEGVWEALGGARDTRDAEGGTEDP